MMLVKNYRGEQDRAPAAEGQHEGLNRAVSVELVVQAVAEDVEAEGGEQDGETGEDAVPWRQGDMLRPSTVRVRS